MRVVIVGATGTWHTQRLTEALTGRGHVVHGVPATRIVAEVDGGDPRLIGAGQVALHEADAVLVRGVPRGSLEQITFRLNSLHVLGALGVNVVNSAAAIERTVDKFLATALLRAGGLRTPRTAVCEQAADAMQAFERLGGDVVVKPVFGAMGSGIVRVEHHDVAQRVFRALELERAVYYLQETIDGPGRRDVRVLVVGEHVVGAIERVAPGWRANIARGARAVAHRLAPADAETALLAARLVGAQIAGVDLLLDRDGTTHVVEVNGIPGWQGLQRATAVDVAPLVAEHLERSHAR